jgi:hypothetical protein
MALGGFHSFRAEATGQGGEGKVRVRCLLGVVRDPPPRDCSMKEHELLCTTTSDLRR